MDKENYLKYIGDNIVRIRKSQNITQEKLANRLEIHGFSLRRIEKGKVNTTIWMLKKIATELNVEVYELIK